MSPTFPITHPTKRHPLTGEPLQAIAVHPRTGRLIWPIMGGDDTIPPAGGQQTNDPPISPERPEGVSEDEWAALGDPGRAAIVREREARQAAERALAATRARPTPPAPKPPAGPTPPEPPKPGDNKGGDLDVEAIVKQAVEAAVKPFQEAEERRQTDQAAEKVRTAVLDAAKARLHDATDAIAYIDLTQVLDGNGQADTAKVTEAIDDLVKRKPHLGKVVDDRRFAPDDAGATPGGSTRPLNDRVKDTLTRMQERAGVKFADPL